MSSVLRLTCLNLDLTGLEAAGVPLGMHQGQWQGGLEDAG